MSIVAPLRRANRQYLQYMEEQLAVLGVRAIEGQILSYLKRQGSRHASDIASTFDLKPSSLKTVLDRMSESGLVKREVERGSRNSTLVHMTVRGNRLATLARAVIEAFDDTVLERVSPGDVEAFQRVLMAIDETAAAQVQLSSKEPTRSAATRGRRQSKSSRKR